jgi:hypothetical protein
LAQREVAERIGVTPQYLSDIERGRRELLDKYVESLPGPVRHAVAVEMVAQHNERGRWLEALLNGSTPK